LRDEVAAALTAGRHPALRLSQPAHPGRDRRARLGGIHFRTADQVGNRIGKKVADWALDNYFQAR
jgi:hypothetical protein